VHGKTGHVTERNSVDVMGRAVAPAPFTDLVLCHNAADAAWSRQLAERIRRERVGDHHFAAQLASWNFSSVADILAEAERRLRTSRFFGLVVSGAMLRADWRGLEKLISSHSDLSWAKGRFVTLLKENVTMPPRLRLREWIDFRDGRQFEESTRELLGLLREDLAPSEGSPRWRMRSGPAEPGESGWKTRPVFAGEKKVRERIVSNLFPVVEIPKEFFAAETNFRAESEIVEVCGEPGPLPFLLKGSKLYTVAPLTKNSVFSRALMEGGKRSQERFTEWLSCPERGPWAVDLLNRLLRHHAWKHGMRFDECHSLYYFTRSKPKKLWWEIGGQTIQREVTAPNTKWVPIENQGKAEVQYGWRHEAIRAGFIQILGALYLRLEPAWFLTELDGKTPATTQPVGPANPLPRNQEGNGQVLRTLQFWSAVFAKGHRELRIDAGANPIRVRLTPSSGSSESGISNDRMDFNRLALTDIDAIQSIPDLAPIDW